ncbi:MAG TPA: L-fucose:H+ symporter permease [Bryobacteraceae bacterium]|nr:L-fucose:H+ symporter permease [Bryobacteraceae bacterium]
MAITNVSSSPVTVSGATSKSNTGAMSMVTTLFFMWGFVTCLNDILIPHLKAIFDLNYAAVMFVQFAFFSGYAVFAFPAGKIVEWIGYKQTMVAGLLTMAVGALLFVPAASVPAFGFFLAALVIVAAGMTALQVSANPYVSVLGPPQTASSRLNLTQAFNSLGTFVAPFFGSVLILKTAPKAISEIKQMSAATLHAYRLEEAASVKLPYLLIAGVLIALAITIALFKLPAISTEPDTTNLEDPNTKTAIKLWKQRHLMLGVLGIFLYVGAEVSIGSFLVNYFSQPYIGAMTEKQAAFYVSFYWGGAMIGRFIGSAILQKLRTGGVLGVVALAACSLVIISMLTFGSIAMWTMILVGLFNSVMFPSIFTLGIAGLGPRTGEGSGLLVAAIVGGAILPVVQGALADNPAIGIHHAFILPVLCYLYISFYGFRGSKLAPATRVMPSTATA